jgi:parallel beta-helix repeat protein
LVVVVEDFTTAISIHDTSAYFFVGNIEIQYTTEFRYYDHPCGMEFDDCSNGGVFDCAIYDVFFGLRMDRCSDFRIRFNYIQGLSDDGSIGVSATSCDNIAILDNEVEYCSYGVRVQTSADGAIQENTISNAWVGVSLDDCRGFLIGSNTFYATVSYYSDDSWTDNIWLASHSITESDLGLVLLLGVVVPTEGAMLLIAYLRLRRRSHER